MLFFFLSFTILLITCQGSLSASYRQTVAERFTYHGSPRLADWPTLPAPDILSVTALESDKFYALSTTGLFLYLGDGAFHNATKNFPGLPLQPGTKIAFLSPTQIAAVTPRAAFLCSQGSSCTSTPADFGTVNGLTTDGKTLFVAGSKGLFTVQDQNIQPIPLKNSTNFISVAVSADGVLVAATADFLWRTLTPKDLSSFHFFRTPGIIDAAPLSIAFDPQGTLWIVNSVCINAQAPDLTFTRYGGSDGVPTNNFTSVSVDATTGDVWAGSQQGLVRYQQSDRSWHYYYGPRYLPGKSTSQGQDVITVQAFGRYSNNPQVAVVTSGGMSFISLKMITLQDKAEALDSLMEKYFFQTSPQPHPYVGYFAGSMELQQFGNMSTWVPQSTDNTGLWTAIYLAGECFRYAVTKDPQVKEKAWKYFEGLEFLNHVTGIDGLMARSVLFQKIAPNDGTWYNSTVAPGWIWKADTSSDEVVGHMMVYPVVFRLLAETPEEKTRAYKLVDSITRRIVENGFKLIDITGKPTTWGRWDPPMVNDYAPWYDQRGVNAAQILSWLVSAYSVTEDPLYLKAFQTLCSQENQYHLNLINAKITQPSDDNFSDDELTYLPYFTYLFAMKYMGSKTLNPAIDVQFGLGLERTQKTVTPYRPTAYNWIYYMYRRGNVDPEIISGAVKTLQEWVLETVDWPCDNSHRLDIYFKRDLNRKKKVDTVQLLPYDERNHQRWNEDPYDNSPDGGGTSITDPGAFVFAYWGSRWAGLGDE